MLISLNCGTSSCISNESGSKMTKKGELLAVIWVKEYQKEIHMHIFLHLVQSEVSVIIGGA